MPRRIEIGLNRVAKEVAIYLVKDLVDTTPVDTSKALSNWIVNQDFPLGIDLDPHYPGSGGSTRAESSRVSIADATDGIRRKEPGSVLYISNYVEYITKLNQGSSRQAPAGFVEGAVDRARRTISKKKLLRGKS